MVDMSHYEHTENLAKTKVLTSLCHESWIAVEAECGRINGGEDGIADTGDLEGKTYSWPHCKLLIIVKLSSLLLRKWKSSWKLE